MSQTSTSKSEKRGALSGWVVVAAWLLTLVAGYFGLGEFLSRALEGIPPERIENIFEPLYSGTSSGMGMGLAVCRSIIESHGGRLWAENRRTRGVTFSFRLPPGREGERQ